jgi:uncharacterized repeat protein (TIGR01451 family)
MRRSRLFWGLAVFSACLAAGVVSGVQGQQPGLHLISPTGGQTAGPGPGESGRSQPGWAQPAPGTGIVPGLPPATQLPSGLQQASPVSQPPSVPTGTRPAKTDGPIENSGPVATSENPTGHQEPAISIEWVGPAVARLNQPTSYQIIAKNVSSAALHNVQVRYQIPQGVRVPGSDPKATSDGNVMSWDLGSLMPAQEKRIDIQLIPEAKVAIECRAHVTFTGSSALKIQVREPKLTLKASAPEHVMVGDTATVSLTVSNPGDGVADHVRIKAVLPDGLEHARGKIVEVELGNLAAGETRNVQLVCMSKTAGPQPVDCVAVADAGLSAQDNCKVEVILPRLDLFVGGPKLRYLDRHAVYTLKVTNPGSGPASNVSIVHQLPQGFKFDKASNGGRHDFTSRTVSWFVGDLMPGESREVSLETIAINVGEHKHTAVATAARGLRTEGEILTRVEGLSALLMELVDTDDPIEVGAETTYEIRVTNTGSKTETNLELVCTVPDRMEFRAAKCNAGCRCRMEGRDVIFEALPKLAPRADVIYRVVVKGLTPGDMRFRARIRADGLSEPVLREESTKVYGDEVSH